MAAKRHELRQRREQLALTQEAAAQALGVATSTYTAWEHGTRSPRVGLRRRVARVFEVSLVEVDRWFGKRSLAPDGTAVPAWLGHLGTLEQGASRICVYEPVVVPGLLQTADYTAALQLGEPEPPSEQDVARRVEARLARQRVLDRQPDPLQLVAVLDESVLHRFAGDRSVMAAQLDHLATAAERPNIDVRVLPLDRQGVFASGWGSFIVLTSPGSPAPYMAWAEDRVGARYLDRPGEVEAHNRLFVYLHSVALSAAESIDLIRTVAKERFS